MGDGDEIVGVQVVAGKRALLSVVTVGGRALLCKAEEVAELAGPGRGVTVIKVDDGDGVVGFGVGEAGDDEIIIAETEGGKKIALGPGHDSVSGRGGKGRPIAKRTKIVKVTPAGGEDEGGDKGGGDDGGGAPTGKKKLLN